ncbi:polyprenol monophosphomannose synthase [Candidatus Micrarchaeota archaeon]|nr:polyprenol monophosphomannose synthase [Candidatus Micrarchaeota archaeon]
MFSIIIPTYNEAGNVKPIISRLRKCLEEAKEDYEIIFVDDNSPDGTADAVDKISKSISNVRLVRRKKKDGLTGAIVAGVNASKGNIIVVMDGDLSHPPETVPLLLSKLKTCDLAVGSRLIEGGSVEHWPFHRKFLSKGADYIARIFLGMTLSDPLSGFFAIRKSIFQKTHFRTKGYKILLNILADNPEIKINEVAYIFRDRAWGETKLGSLEIINYVFDLLRLKLH